MAIEIKRGDLTSRKAHVQVTVGGKTVLFRMPASELKDLLPDWQEHFRVAGYEHSGDHKTHTGKSHTGKTHRGPAQESKSAKEPGDLVKTLRKKKELTQAELAKALGTTQANISAIEGKSRRIGLAMARKLASALQANYQDFVSQ